MIGFFIAGVTIAVLGLLCIVLSNRVIDLHRKLMGMEVAYQRLLIENYRLQREADRGQG